ncbi:MAG: DegQ family serine endoprotease [Bacteroidetes bacterium]|nr:DegQ family serine endoprotease [Bacteroidota bacterium]
MFSKKTPYFRIATLGAVLLLLYFSEFSFSNFTNADQTSRELPIELRQETQNTNNVYQTDPTETLKNLNSALANIAEKANPAVVTIKSKQTVQVRGIDPFAPLFGRPGSFTQEQVREGLGSGVIVSKDGYILTNNHVVEGADELLIKVMDVETEMLAKVIGTDPQTDIAVLKIESADDLPILDLGDSDELRVGEIVIAVGSPLDIGLAHTVTMGIVSARGRANLRLAEYEDFIQTDAAINPGNSGGALVNLEGKLIGINTAIASRSGGNQGIGFSIPINMARNVMESLIKDGKVSRGYIGVYMQDITPKFAKALDLKSSDGVIVNQVEANSPASRAGLKEGDIIIEFDEKKTKNMHVLRTQVASTKPGSKVKVLILRDGDEKKITVVLDERGSSAIAATTEEASESLSKQLKFDYQTLSSELSRKFEIKDDVKGVVITGIDARSMSYRSGLREGDVIISVKRNKIEDVKSFEKEMKRYKKGDVVMLRILRSDTYLYLTLEM